MPYTKKDMFDLVLDVESYASFIPEIRKSQIVKKEKDFFLADLTLKAFPLSYRSYVYYDRENFSYIKAESNSFPLKHLKACWVFHDENFLHSRIHLSLDFKLKFPLFHFSFFSFAERIVSLFEHEAHKKYKK